MPELPEVETIKTAIQNTLKNAVFLDVTINNTNLRQVVPDNLPSILRLSTPISINFPTFSKEFKSFVLKLYS